MNDPRLRKLGIEELPNWVIKFHSADSPEYCVKAGDMWYWYWYLYIKLNILHCNDYGEKEGRLAHMISTSGYNQSKDGQTGTTIRTYSNNPLSHSNLRPAYLEISPVQWFQKSLIWLIGCKK